MGMFDYFKSSYDIGALTNVECQTKDMDPYGGSMSFYWLDPAGLLWSADYSGTHSIELLADENLSPWEKIKWHKTGNRGRFFRVYTTNYIKVYDTKIHPDGFVDLIECKIHLRSGVLQEFTYINNSI